MKWAVINQQEKLLSKLKAAKEELKDETKASDESEKEFEKALRKSPDNTSLIQQLRMKAEVLEQAVQTANLRIKKAEDALAELKQNQQKMRTGKKKSIDRKRYEITGDVHL